MPLLWHQLRMKILSQSVIARSALCDVAISFHTFLNNEKMRSSRGKAPLRMTGVVSDEILTPSKSEGSGWRIKAPSPPRKRHPSTGGELFNFFPHWGGIQGGVPFTFLFHHFSLILSFQDRLPCFSVAPHKYENTFPLTYVSPTRGEEKI